MMNSLWTSGVVAIVWVCLLGGVLGTAGPATAGSQTAVSETTTTTAARP